MAATLPARHEVPVAYTWDAYSIFPNDEAWEAAIRAAEKQIEAVAAFKGRLSESAATLVKYLDESEALSIALGKIRVYAMMFEAVDTGNAAAIAKKDRATGVGSKASAARAFAEPEILAIGGDVLARWMKADPKLAVYAHSFERLHSRKAHTRSAEVEQVLRMADESFGSANATHGLLANADLRFSPARSSDGETFEVGQGNLGALVTHPDRAVRKSAWESYADAHLAVKNTIANCVATCVKQHVFALRTRNYPNSLEAALKPNHIPPDVFHKLIDTYKKNIPTWQRYWRVRRKALKLDKLHVYDIKAPLARPQKVSWQQSVEWICEGMRPLGDDYVSVMRRGLVEERWVDVYPNRGKRSGAFSSGSIGTRPFILMSYNDDIYSLSTLAHELGHSMHKHYTQKHQPPVYANYTLFVAEVASNFNQAMVRAHLLDKNKDRDFQIAVIEEAMANFHRYFFIMPTLARFELEIHQRGERGQALTAASMISLMADLFGEGYGDEVVQDRDRTGITWAQFATHIYSNFYTYQYATGISGAHALCSGILSGRPDAVKNYLAFLSAGNSLYPLDALKLAGVDLTTPEPVEQTFAVLSGLVDRLEKLTS